MLYPELKFFPTVIFAHSDDSNKYLTSLGLFSSGAVYHWYVKPEANWLNEGYSLSSKEYLSVEFLNETGDEIDFILDRIRIITFGYTPIYTTPLQRLAALLKKSSNHDHVASKLQKDLMSSLKDITELLPKAYQSRFGEELDLNPDCGRLNSRHAGDVALCMILTVLKLNDFGRIE